MNWRRRSLQRRRISVFVNNCQKGKGGGGIYVIVHTSTSWAATFFEGWILVEVLNIRAVDWRESNALKCDCWVWVILLSIESLLLCRLLSNMALFSPGRLQFRLGPLQPPHEFLPLKFIPTIVGWNPGCPHFSHFWQDEAWRAYVYCCRFQDSRSKVYCAAVMGFGTNLIVAPTCFALGIIFCNWYLPCLRRLTV